MFIVCVCLDLWMRCLYVKRRFESLICDLDVCLSSLYVALISMCFSLLEKPSFFKLDTSLIDSFLSSFSFSFLDSISIASQSIEISRFLLDKILTASWSIEISRLLLNTFLTASRSIKTNSCALYVYSIDSRQTLDPSRFMVFLSIASRQLLDLSRPSCMYCFSHLISLHSCIYMDSLCSLDHLYVSRVKFYNFLYPLSIMTKRGRKCGFFLRFYMLWGEIHAL